MFISVSIQAQNMDPKTELEYAQVMMDCLTENIPRDERWEAAKFRYARGEINTEGKNEVSVSAEYTSDDIEWKEVNYCHPMAPIIITEAYLKNIGKFDDKFESIKLEVRWVGDFKVNIYQK